MSNEAINWAFAQPIKHSTAKFVLVVMANHAPDGDWLAWPSVASLAEATGQDRKTVLENLKRLAALGYIVDTGARKGATKQVPVYQLNREPVPVSEQSQKRDDTENGTVPKFPSNSPVFPVKQSQNSVETVPKTGHGTIKEPSKEPSGNHQKAASKSRPGLGVADLVDLGVEKQVAEDWLSLRAKKRLPLTRTALDQTIAEVEKAGMALPAALKLCCGRGWAGFNASWLTPRANTAGGAASDKFAVANLDHSSSRAAMEASIRRHNITVPDGDIEF